MPAGFALVNHTKKQIIQYLNLPCSTRYEISNHAVVAAITTWYLFEHSGDYIVFVSDNDWQEALSEYEDKTHDTTDALIKKEILIGCEPAKLYIFPDGDEDDCWFRNVKHNGVGSRAEIQAA